MMKGGFSMSDKFGVITEQGYPMDGSYGYKPLNEEDNRKILEENAKKDSDKKNDTKNEKE
jgi:hypothetical protein